MPLFNGFKFSFNLSSKNDLKLALSENNTSEVFITGAYKVVGEDFIRSGSYGEAPKKITPSMVKLPSSFQPDPTDSDVIQASKSTGDLSQQSQLHKLPPELRKSTPIVSPDPRGAAPNNRQSTDLRNVNNAQPKVNSKEQIKLDKKRLAEQKKQEKLLTQQRAKEEKLRKEREKAELKERAKQEKLRIQREKAEAAKAKKGAKKNVPPKTSTNPLAQGPNAPLPYSTNTIQSSISKTSGPPPYEANNSGIEARNLSSSSAEGEQSAKDSQNKDNSGNVSFAAPAESSTWDMVAQHRVQVARAPVGGAANKVAIRLQETDPDVKAVTGRKSLYV